MSIRRSDCPWVVELDETKVEQLRALPDGTHEVDSTHYCELDAGHPGRHVACGQDLPDEQNCVTWWVWWTDDGSGEIAPGDTCPATQAEDYPDSDPCLLPAGHPGGHSYT